MKDETATYSAVERVTRYVLSGVKKATIYIAPKFTVKATRQGKLNKRNKTVTMIVTAGRPNYHERDFIQKCLKSNEPFPIKKAQLVL